MHQNIGTCGCTPENEKPDIRNGAMPIARLFPERVHCATGAAPLSPRGEASGCTDCPVSFGRDGGRLSVQAWQARKLVKTMQKVPKKSGQAYRVNPHEHALRYRNLSMPYLATSHASSLPSVSKAWLGKQPCVPSVGGGLNMCSRVHVAFAYYPAKRRRIFERNPFHLFETFSFGLIFKMKKKEESCRCTSTFWTSRFLELSMFDDVSPFFLAASIDYSSTAVVEPPFFTTHHFVCVHPLTVQSSLSYASKPCNFAEDPRVMPRSQEDAQRAEKHAYGQSKYRFPAKFKRLRVLNHQVPGTSYS